MKQSELNIVTPGTFGVYSTNKASSPYLYSCSYGNCVGLAIRGKDYAVLVHFFASSHVAVEASFAAISATLSQHFGAGDNPLVGASFLVFKGGAPNGTSGKMVSALVELAGKAGRVSIAKLQHRDVLYNGVSGVLEETDLNTMKELKTRDLFLAASSMGGGDASGPVEWNYAVNYKSEPEGNIVMPNDFWGKTVTEKIDVNKKKTGLDWL